MQQPTRSGFAAALSLLFVSLASAEKPLVAVGDSQQSVIDAWGAPSGRMKSGSSEVLHYKNSIVDLTMRDGRVHEVVRVPFQHGARDDATLGWELEEQYHFRNSQVRMLLGGSAGEDGTGWVDGSSITPGTRACFVVQEWGRPFWQTAADGSVVLRYTNRVVEVVVAAGRVVGIQGRGSTKEERRRREEELRLSSVPLPVAQGAIGRPVEPSPEKPKSRLARFLELALFFLTPVITAICIVTGGLTLLLGVTLRPTREDPRPLRRLFATERHMAKAVCVEIAVWAVGVVCIVVYFTALSMPEIALRLDFSDHRTEATRDR